MQMVYPATVLVLVTVAIMLVLFGLGWHWARTHGQFDDFEAAKHRMLENERGYDDERFRPPVARH
jgi:cbb3-type cytochrome oxidase maturation protein